MQNYCQNCGKLLPKEPASFCPNCGTAVNQQKETSQTENEFEKILSSKDPFLAALLSFLFPGLGQVYNGQFNRGLLVQLIFLLSIICGSSLWIFILIPLAVWILGMYDAYNEADKMRKGAVQLKNPTVKEALVFILWPFLIIGMLAFLALIFAFFILIFIIFAAAAAALSFLV